MKRPTGFDLPEPGESAQNTPKTEVFDEKLRSRLFKPLRSQLTSRREYLDSVRASVAEVERELSVWDADHPEEIEAVPSVASERAESVKKPRFFAAKRVVKQRAQKNEELLSQEGGELPAIKAGKSRFLGVKSVKNRGIQEAADLRAQKTAELSAQNTAAPEKTTAQRLAKTAAQPFTGKTKEARRKQTFDVRCVIAEIGSSAEVKRARQELKNARKQSRNATKKAVKKRSVRELSFAQKITASICATVAIVAFAVVIIVISPLMSVRQITLEGASEQLAPEVTEALQELRGEPLALIGDKELYRVLSPFKRIQRYSYETVPPDLLLVRVHERVPVIAVAVGERYRVLDAAGVSLAEGITELPDNMPVATGLAADVRTDAFTAATAVLRNITPELRSEVQEVQATGAQDVTFIMRGGLRVNWGNAQDVPLKMAIFERMRASLADRNISVIDVSSTQAPVFR
ncbi:cell division protein FtsQ/DivIB [Canibacter sp. lx-45]|uniref:cell division protein FtsQ/DivIB n=1 Tax=Canibacter zhuwentaonis TaxID=2837491 RepID=UPI001BDBC435|nr:cell division protein FtsQ/DivIB [Canibacter zhuwentaonis]MBT1035259.1 cell division protein FtsQ/DivIB [Canibacter zhuwentaonis]